MDSRDYISHVASSYDQDDDLAEDNPGLAILGLRVLTVLFGLFILLPLVVFSPVALMVCAVVSRNKEQSVTETPGGQPDLYVHHSSVVPASIEEFAIELIAG